MKHAIETSLGQILAKRLPQADIAEAYVLGDLIKPWKGLEIYALYKRDGISKSIPPFDVPFQITAPDNSQIYVADLRPYSNRIEPMATQNNIISKQGPSGFLSRSLLATQVWIDDPDRYTSTGSFPIYVFGTWIANQLNATFGFNASSGDTTANQIKALAIYWAYCQRAVRTEVFEYRGVTPQFIQGAAKLATMNSMLRTEEVVDLFNRAGIIRTVEEFCNAIKLLKARNIDKVNPKLINSLCVNGWKGIVNSDRYVVMSLEYVPFFYNIVYEIMTNSSYKRTLLGSLIDSLKSVRNYNAPAFARSFENMIKDIED